MIHKDMRYRRFQRRNAIARKSKISRLVYGSPMGTGYTECIGKLDKGKVHCSCAMCSAKTKRNFGKRDRSWKSWKISDIKKMQSLEDKVGCLGNLEESA